MPLATLATAQRIEIQLATTSNQARQMQQSTPFSRPPTSTTTYKRGETVLLVAGWYKQIGC